MVLLLIITMLDLLVVSVTSITAWFNVLLSPQPKLQPVEVFPWEQSAVFTLPKFNRDRLVKPSSIIISKS